jgi:hypothetical protein
MASARSAKMASRMPSTVIVEKELAEFVWLGEEEEKRKQSRAVADIKQDQYATLVHFPQRNFLADLLTRKSKALSGKRVHLLMHHQKNHALAFVFLECVI